MNVLKAGRKLVLQYLNIIANIWGEIKSKNSFNNFLKTDLSMDQARSVYSLWWKGLYIYQTQITHVHPGK